MSDPLSKSMKRRLEAQKAPLELKMTGSEFLALVEWAHTNPRKSPEIAFTSGVARDCACVIEAAFPNEAGYEGLEAIAEDLWKKLDWACCEESETGALVLPREEAIERIMAALQRAVAVKGATEKPSSDHWKCPACGGQVYTLDEYNTRCDGCGRIWVKPAHGAIPEEQPKFITCKRCGKSFPDTGDSMDTVHTCTQLAGSEEQDKGSKFAHAADAAAALAGDPQVGIEVRNLIEKELRVENATLHKLVREMVEVMELFPAAHAEVGDKGGWVYIKDWEELSEKSEAVLAKAKLEKGEGR